VDDSGVRAMDFRKERLLADALIQYGEERAGLERGDAMDNIHRILSRGGTTKSDDVNLENGSSPYGFDHNYAIANIDDESSLGQQHQQQHNNSSLRLAAILSHPPTGRSLRLFTTAPGLQLYTSNYLNGKTPPRELCKNRSEYCRWGGVCLETQTYPDSIFPCDAVDGDGNDDEFAKGRCFILRPGGRDYSHDVEYEFHRL